MERTKFFQRKGKEFHRHWQRKGNRKRWKGWCEIIGTSEHTENSKSVLELRETGHQYKDCWVNLGRWPQQQSQGHSNSLGKGSDAKGKSGKGGGKRKIQRCWSTCVESTAESSSELSGIVYTTDRDKHNGWHG